MSYVFAFTICPRVLSVQFFFFFLVVFSACYHWWICFLDWLLSSFFLFLLTSYCFNLIFNNWKNFYFNNFILFYFIYLFLFFSLFFWAVRLTGSWCTTRVSGVCLWGGRAELRTLVHQRPPGSTQCQMAKALPEISISMLRPSSTQRPARYSAAQPMPNN